MAALLPDDWQLELADLHHTPLPRWSLVTQPRLLPLAITYAIYGFHFCKVTEAILRSQPLDADG